MEGAVGSKEDNFPIVSFWDTWTMREKADPTFECDEENQIYSGQPGFSESPKMNRIFKEEDKDLKKFQKFGGRRWILSQIIIIGSDSNNSTNIVYCLSPTSTPTSI